jgi:hypothetical protein
MSWTVVDRRVVDAVLGDRVVGLGADTLGTSPRAMPSSMSTTGPVVREDGVWRICPAAPTP